MLKVAAAAAVVFMTFAVFGITGDTVLMSASLGLGTYYVLEGRKGK